MSSATYRAYRSAVAPSASSANYLSVMNGSGSGKTVKVTRVWVTNSHTSSVTGGLSLVELWLVTGVSGPTSVTTIIAHDTANAALPAQITLGHSGTLTLDTTEPFLKTLTTTEEAKLSTGTIGELNTMPALMCIWDAGYGDSDVEPITLPEGYGLSIRSGAAGNTSGSQDFVLEFVVE